MKKDMNAFTVGMHDAEVFPPHPCCEAIPTGSELNFSHFQFVHLIFS